MPADRPDYESMVLDRIELGTAELLAEDGEWIAVGAGLLPRECQREGLVLRIPRDRDGKLDWYHATVDEEATRARREEAERLLGELRKRDPGGDVTL